MEKVNIEIQPPYVKYLYNRVVSGIRSLALVLIKNEDIYGLWEGMFATLLLQLEMTLHNEDMAGFEILADLAHVKIECARLMIARGIEFTPHDLNVASSQMWRAVHKSEKLPE
jgi:hypothetical protein